MRSVVSKWPLPPNAIFSLSATSSEEEEEEEEKLNLVSVRKPDCENNDEFKLILAAHVFFVILTPGRHQW